MSIISGCAVDRYGNKIILDGGEPPETEGVSITIPEDGKYSAYLDKPTSTDAFSTGDLFTDTGKTEVRTVTPLNLKLPTPPPLKKEVEELWDKQTKEQIEITKNPKPYDPFEIWTVQKAEQDKNLDPLNNDPNTTRIITDLPPDQVPPCIYTVEERAKLEAQKIELAATCQQEIKDPKANPTIAKEYGFPDHPVIGIVDSKWKQVAELAIKANAILIEIISGNSNRL